MRRLLSIGLVGLLGLLTACGAEVLLAADFSLSVETATEGLVIEQGGRGRVTVKVNRLLPVNVSPFPVTVRLVAPVPAGVRSAGVEVPPGVSEARMVITVDRDAEPRGPFTVRVEGVGLLPVGLLPKQAEFELRIAAAGGS